MRSTKWKARDVAWEETNAIRTRKLCTNLNMVREYGATIRCENTRATRIGMSQEGYGMRMYAKSMMRESWCESSAGIVWR